MKKKIVYVDMDNTIVDFKSGIEKLSKEDYANPIEPSHIGGEKLAKAIIQWMKNS